MRGSRSLGWLVRLVELGSASGAFVPSQRVPKSWTGAQLRQIRALYPTLIASASDTDLFFARLSLYIALSARATTAFIVSSDTSVVKA